eukprot:g2731.t1
MEGKARRRAASKHRNSKRGGPTSTPDKSLSSNDAKKSSGNREFAPYHCCLMLFLLLLFLPVLDMFNRINVGHLIIEFNGRNSVSFVAIEGYHDLRNKSETICMENKATHFHMCAHQIHVRMKDLLASQAKDYDRANIFLRYYVYSSVEIATKHGIFVCRFNPFRDVRDEVRHFMHMYVNYFNFYKPYSEEYVSTMKLMEREVKDRIINAAGRKLEVAFLMTHLFIVVALHGTLSYYGKGKVGTGNDGMEDRLPDNDGDFTLNDALSRENRHNNYLSVTKLVLTIIVMYGHSFDLSASASRVSEPLFFAITKQNIAIVACSILFFIAGILSTQSLVDRHKSVFTFLCRAYKRILPTYVLMAVGSVVIYGK